MANVDYSRLSAGHRLQVESEGKFYAAEVVMVSDSKKRAKAPVKVHYLGYDSEYDEWVGGNRLRSKALNQANKDGNDKNDVDKPPSPRTPLSKSASSFTPGVLGYQDGFIPGDTSGAMWINGTMWFPPPLLDESLWQAESSSNPSTSKLRKGQTRRKDEPRYIQISKTLTQILRHTADSLGLEMGDDGYCELAAVLKTRPLSSLRVREGEIEEACQDRDKKRFELKTSEDGRRYIRAVQGHSVQIVDDEKLLRRLDLKDEDLPQHCIHGTYEKRLAAIYESGGLLPGGSWGKGLRNHVHFSPKEPGDKAVISGMRQDCEIAIYIDLKRALEDGVPFYRSANDVLLSPGLDGRVDQKYFKNVLDLRSGQAVHTK